MIDVADDEWPDRNDTTVYIRNERLANISNSFKRGDRVAVEGSLVAPAMNKNVISASSITLLLPKE